tara:strand:- start:552 stop:713 length:162 start_codon:yes stop_codon:yes gene_type:complete
MIDVPIFSSQNLQSFPCLALPRSHYCHPVKATSLAIEIAGETGKIVVMKKNYK